MDERLPEHVALDEYYQMQDDFKQGDEISILLANATKFLPGEWDKIAHDKSMRPRDRILWLQTCCQALAGCLTDALKP